MRHFMAAMMFPPQIIFVFWNIANSPEQRAILDARIGGNKQTKTTNKSPVICDRC